MDQGYRVFSKGEDPKSGEVVTGLKLKSIITQPVNGEHLPEGMAAIPGAAYAGPVAVERVEVSVDGGQTWNRAAFIGPHEPCAWRQWQYLWEAVSIRIGQIGQ
jgi:sulfite oxidase